MSRGVDLVDLSLMLQLTKFGLIPYSLPLEEAKAERERERGAGRESQRQIQFYSSQFLDEFNIQIFNKCTKPTNYDRDIECDHVTLKS